MNRQHDASAYRAPPDRPGPDDASPDAHAVLDRLADPTLGGGRALIAQPGLLTNAHAIRMLRAAGWRPGLGRTELGRPGLGRTGLGRTGARHRPTHLTVWGRKALGAPARNLAAAFGIPLLTMEDGFLHGIRPPLTPRYRRLRGPLQPPPLSLLLDDRGIHIDPARPSRL
ncbi:MAG: hypothetical protein AAFN05_04580, partial [Pseudomonadota bacterium]